jgi:putative aldouronate transport system permease protein
MAYALSRKRFTGRAFIMKVVTFTMLFNGGIIPTYLIIRGMGMIDTIWAIVLSGAVSAWNLIVTRTFFDGMPDSLEESGIIEGCNDIQVFYYIFLPLSLPITATMILFYAVGQWNSFFVPLLYLNDKKKFPLMIFLRNLLIQGDVTQYEGMGNEVSVVQQGIKYAIIVVTTLPIVLVYPFLQKYFVKGVMIGSIKG